MFNQNTLSALDEMRAFTNFDDIINNDNINEATQLLFDRINNALKLCFSIRTKTWVAYYSSHSFAKQHIDDWILHVYK